MKKKDALILVAALSCLFFLLSFSFVFELENFGYREDVRRRRALQEEGGAGGQGSSWFSDFFQPRCRCPKFRPYRYEVSADAHALATHATFESDMCHITKDNQHNSRVDIQVGDLLRTIRLRYPQYVYHHTGWVQEMDIKYSASRWRNKVLKVFFVLHSHNDPGWRNTYSSCFTTWTQPTLDRAINLLDKFPELKFVWAEVIYLQHWYREATAVQRRQLKRVLQSGQFEVVTGGWVMTDEATTHYGAMLEQLINGHQWLANTLDIQPRHSWQIDPFGHSSTLAYMLKRAGIEGTVLQRVHYAVKQHLAYNKQLEFIWTQHWDSHVASTGLLTHMMPYLYYSIPYSCGPNIQTCCRLDFYASKCWAWGKYQKPQPVTDNNIKELSEALLDQLRKKAEFFQHDVLLVPHGDDFRYATDLEWENQTSNLRKLFAHMNARPDMNVKIQFGTVADYFDAMKEVISIAPSNDFPSNQTEKQSETIVLPTLSGDMFTYTDRDDQYWSGFYTSRPYLKGLVRKLEAQLRMVEILYTLSHTHATRKSVRLASESVSGHYRTLEGMRSTLGLLQHHDAVTGTAKEEVTADYLSRAQNALADAEGVVTFMLGFLMELLLNPSAELDSFKPVQLDLVTGLVDFPAKEVGDLAEQDQSRIIVVHNPLAVERTDVITVTVTSPDVTVIDIKGRQVTCQIGPVWAAKTEISDQQFQLTMEVNVPALGIARYQVKPVPSGTGCAHAYVKIFNGQPSPTNRKVFVVRHHSTLPPMVYIETLALRATICMCTGLLKTVTTKMDGTDHHTEMRVITYGTGSWKNPYRDKSGAYIFMPDSTAQEIKYDNPVVIVTEGLLLSSITTHVPLMSQKITLLNTTGPLAASLRVENTVDITAESNLEVAVRILSDVLNDNNVFHTDLNGFQMSRRQTLSRLPLQGNFYPVTSAIFVQDKLFRLTALTAQSHGAASLHPGWLELLLDRKLDQDDWRGLNEGIQDNVAVTSTLLLLWETRHISRDHNTARNESADQSKSTAFLSLLSHLSSQMLNNPVAVRVQRDKRSDLTSASLAPLNYQLPCDVHLLNLRALGAGDPTVTVLAILHRVGSDCGFPEVYKQCKDSGGKIKWTQLFSQVRITTVDRMLLTGTKAVQRVHHSYLTLQPMEIATFKVSIS